MKTTYTIKHTDGASSTSHETMSEAIEECERMYGEDIEVGEDEEAGPDGEMRRLIWASEEEAENDDGSQAVASIRWTDE